MLPETVNKTLPQTTEDTEQMGLAWYVFHSLTNIEKTNEILNFI